MRLKWEGGGENLQWPTFDRCRTHRGPAMEPKTVSTFEESMFCILKLDVRDTDGIHVVI